MSIHIKSYAGALLVFKRIPNLINRNKKIHNAFRWLFSTNGLVLTILLGILINGTSNFLQDKIQRQRYLELLQLEIRMNHSKAKGEIIDFEKNGRIFNYTPFETSVYESGLQSGYLLTIDPKEQAYLFVLYNTTIPKLNNIAGHQYNMILDYQTIWEKCVFDLALSKGNGKNNCDEEHGVFQNVEKTYSGFIYNTAQQTEKSLWEASIKFNPTQDRLNSPVLRLLMGDDRLKIQE